ncbi:MAG: NlpC/P60 family protein [Bacteroidetes bacterium]|nr:MAG: NlpC/P60 family protein [Bacteroidota bacterium]
MIQKLKNIITKMLILAIVSSFVIFETPVLYSASTKKISSVKSKHKKKRKHRHKRRHYNPSKTRALSIDIIRANSEQICALAGLNPMPSDSLGKLPTLVTDDSENVDPYDDNYEGEIGENLTELEQEDDVPVDMESFKMLWLSYVDDDKTDEMTSGGINKKDIMDVIMHWLGTPYRFGGRSKSATDCSGFVQNVFMESSNLLLPRTARNQFNVGMKIRRSELQFGDLIFFHTYTRRYPSHVGIYLGDDLFAQASSRYGVTVSSLESTYYKKRFIGGRRLSVQDIVRYSKNPDALINSTQ